jgi:hypothetical protein
MPAIVDYGVVCAAITVFLVSSSLRFMARQRVISESPPMRPKLTRTFIDAR